MYCPEEEIDTEIKGHPKFVIEVIDLHDNP